MLRVAVLSSGADLKHKTLYAILISDVLYMLLEDKLNTCAIQVG